MERLRRLNDKVDRLQLNVDEIRTEITEDRDQMALEAEEYDQFHEIIAEDAYGIQREDTEITLGMWRLMDDYEKFYRMTAAKERAKKAENAMKEKPEGAEKAVQTMEDLLDLNMENISERTQYNETCQGVFKQT